MRTEMIHITRVALLDVASGYVFEFCLRGTFKFFAFLLKVVMPTVA